MDKNDFRSLNHFDLSEFSENEKQKMVEAIGKAPWDKGEDIRPIPRIGNLKIWVRRFVIEDLKRIGENDIANKLSQLTYHEKVFN